MSIFIRNIMSNFTAQKQTIGLASWLLLCFATAVTCAFGSMNAPEFYGQLTQPNWAPPAWLFGPVWITLYTLMAIAALLVWRQGGLKANKSAMILFVVQLFINGLWSWLFFAWQMGLWSFVDIVILWVLILVTLLKFGRVRLLAAVLLIPYLMWVSFATALNFSMWQSNTGIL